MRCRTFQFQNSLSVLRRSKSLRLSPAVLLLLLMFIFLPHCSGSSSSKDIVIKDAWARPAKIMSHNMADTSHAHPMMTSAVYLTIENHTGAADQLLEARADVCQAVELHQTQIVDDRMRMRKIDGGIEIPAGGQVELKPGSYHIMLIGLTGSLQPGDSFPVELIFRNAGRRTISVTVKPIGK